MPKKFTASESQLKPDPRYQDKVLSKFINCVMREGKKGPALRVVYRAFDEIQARLDKEKPEALPKTAIEVFHKAVENVRPVVEVRSKRVGGANYQARRCAAVVPPATRWPGPAGCRSAASACPADRSTPPRARPSSGPGRSHR